MRLLLVPIGLSLLGGACAHRPAGPPSGFVVTAGEDQVWPPTDPACAPVVACCDALAALDRDLVLTCPIAAASRESCDAIARTALAKFGLMSRDPAPAACRPFAPRADEATPHEVGGR